MADNPIDAFIKRTDKRLKRKAIPLEAEDEKQFEDWCKELGIWCIKLVFLFGKGWPDRTLICPGGRIIFIELKRSNRRNHKNGGLSPKQIEVRDKILSYGFPYYVTYGLKEAKKKVCQELNLRSGHRGSIK